MNLTGLSNYSKETVGLRQSDQIKNQQFRLIYAYPLLFCDMINPVIKMNIRKFLTESYIREIIVNNSLNIISVASQIQSDSSQPNNVAQLIGNALLTGGGQNTQNNTIPVTNQNVNPYEVQQRVKEKTEIIKRYLESDPRTKKLSPSVEMITLKNLIDVPLIVGTKGFDVATNTMMYILAVAIASQTPLNKLSNVDKIVTQLRNTPQDKWFSILTSLVKQDPRFLERYVERLKKEYPGLQLNRVTSAIIKYIEKDSNLTGFKNDNFITKRLPFLRRPNQIETEKRDLTVPATPSVIENNPMFNILKLAKDKLGEVLLQFKFVLDPTMLKNQVGLDTANNTMEASVVKLSSNQKQIFMQMHDKFMELVSTPGSVYLSSAFNSLYPAPVATEIAPAVAGGVPTYDYNQTPVNMNINFLELKEKYIDVELYKNTQSMVLDTFSKEISNSLSSISPNETQERVKLLKSICQSMSKIDEILYLEAENFSRSHTLPSTNFSSDQLQSFTSGLSRLANTFGTMNKRFENVFAQLVNNSSSLLKLIQARIYSSLENFFRDIYDRPNYSSMMTYLHNIDPNRVTRIYIPQMTDTLFIIFYFFFLYRLQAAICQFMDKLDIEIESKVNDVFEFPNYTLVLPLDIVMGIQAAYTANNFNELISGTNVSAIKSLNDNYVKGMIKFMFSRLKVPAIIVIDEKKKELYYQFMYMSAPEKMSFTTLESFIKST